MAKTLKKVYLAGPMTNCSQRQKTEWRKKMGSALQKENFKPLDPTDKDARKGALAVNADIEEADVVIANMWRESIGTSIGIVQARRMGIPVILIDPHYIDSPLLKSIVGDFIVHDETAAIRMLKKDVLPLLDQEITVKKRDGTAVVFSLKKLQNSLKAACLQVGIDDPIFHILWSRRVHRAILSSLSTEAITTETIRNQVFQELQKIQNDSEFAREHELLAHAKNLQYEWEVHEQLMKKSAEDVAKHMAEVDDLIGELAEKQLEIDNLTARLNILAPIGPPEVNTSVKARARFDTVTEKIEKALGQQCALCVSSLGKTSFASAFLRQGVSEADFRRLFKEQPSAGRGSNLNHQLANMIKSFPFVLYASEGLRHLSDPRLRAAPNLISGAGPNDVVRKFLDRIS